VNLEKEKVMKKMLWALAVVPFLAVAAPPPGGGPGGPPGGEGPNPEQMQKRMRLARTLGLAEALDLSDAEALKVRDTMNKFDEKRAPLQKQLWESMQVLRKAAGGDQAATKEVDKAIKTAFDARAQIQVVDRESFQAVTKDMSPEKRAKAALFLARFQGRMKAEHMHGPGMGPGMGRGMGRGMMGGMGPGGMGPGPHHMDCPDDCPMHARD
jgi:BMFP domain-containing protein YqiC